MKLSRRIEQRAEAKRDQVEASKRLTAHVRGMSDQELLEALQAGDVLADGPVAQMLGLRTMSDAQLLTELEQARQEAGESFTPRPPVRVEDDPLLSAPVCHVNGAA